MSREDEGWRTADEVARIGRLGRIPTAEEKRVGREHIARIRAQMEQGRGRPVVETRPIDEETPT